MLQSMGSQKVRHDWATELNTSGKIIQLKKELWGPPIPTRWWVAHCDLHLIMKQEMTEQVRTLLGNSAPDFTNVTLFNFYCDSHFPVEENEPQIDESHWSRLRQLTNGKADTAIQAFWLQSPHSPPLWLLPLASLRNRLINTNLRAWRVIWTLLSFTEKA